jgi:hypothetical protein
VTSSASPLKSHQNPVSINSFSPPPRLSLLHSAKQASRAAFWCCAVPSAETLTRRAGGAGSLQLLRTNTRLRELMWDGNGTTVLGFEAFAAVSCPPSTPLPKVNTNCTTPSLIPAVTGHTGSQLLLRTDNCPQPKEAQPLSHALNIRSIEHFDSSALWSDGPEVTLNWLFP